MAGGCCRYGSRDARVSRRRRLHGAPNGAIAEAIAVGGDRILAVGSRATIDGYIGPSTRVVELRGGMVLPGIIDTHAHFASGSLARTQVALDDAQTPAQVVERVAAFARAHPNEPWILGGNWQYDAFAPSGLPTKALLDVAVPDRPAALDAFDGHTLWANSKALALAGITRDTPDPLQNGVVLGTIVRDPATGEPTGAFKEGAQALIRRVIPVPSRDRMLTAIGGGLAAANARGITGVINASGDLDEMDLYQTLHDRGELTIRMTTAYSAGAGTRHTLSPEELAAFETARRRYTGDWVRAGIVKFFMDGVVETYTADLLAPYVANDDDRRAVLPGDSLRGDARRTGPPRFRGDDPRHRRRRRSGRPRRLRRRERAQRAARPALAGGTHRGLRSAATCRALRSSARSRRCSRTIFAVRHRTAATRGRATSGRGAGRRASCGATSPIRAR